MTTVDPIKRAAQNHRYYLKKGKAIIQARSEEYTERNRAYVDDLKASLPCTDCGNFWLPCVMQFDHIGTDKRANISVMVADSYSLESIIVEIAKCEPVCANCHAVRTWTRRNRAPHS